MSTKSFPSQIKVIDSHTGGEPTRLVIDGWPQPKGETMVEKLDYLKEHDDHIRAAVVCEPRGHNAIVGAFLTPPVNEGSEAGVVFFNDVGYLGMCGHALFGAVATLKHIGRIEAGTVKIDTPAGVVTAVLEADGNMTIENVVSYVYRKNVEVNVPNLGVIKGDVAYGGNWFFLTDNYAPELSMSNIDNLMQESKAVRTALIDAEVFGEDGAIVDHIEFFGKPDVEGADSKNFVLCPGNAYDRAPCGTGTSAKLAGLHAKGKIEIGQHWVQESITGSTYECFLEEVDGVIKPFLISKAFITGENTLLFNPEDPFVGGII